MGLEVPSRIEIYSEGVRLTGESCGESEAKHDFCLVGGDSYWFLSTGNGFRSVVPLQLDGNRKEMEKRRRQVVGYKGRFTVQAKEK